MSPNKINQITSNILLKLLTLSLFIRNPMDRASKKEGNAKENGNKKNT